MEAVYRSLERETDIGRYDFFILSDTRDPEAWAEEEAAWAGLRERVGGQDRIFYRRRRVNTKMKSGNIADFCRRFGAHYIYMLVLDADSIMGATAFCCDIPWAWAAVAKATIKTDKSARTNIGKTKRLFIKPPSCFAAPAGRPARRRPERGNGGPVPRGRESHSISVIHPDFRLSTSILPVGEHLTQEGKMC